jgi:hypothetical protein
MVFCCFSHIGLTARQEPEWRADFPRLHATSPKMNGGKMADRLKFALLSLLVALVTFVAAPSAMADGWDKETLVTFSSPVEVPGQVLLPGTYVFKLADSQSDRGIVQIFSEDHSRLLATILAVPDYRLTPTEKNVISFEERPSGTPEALHSWFYPGDNYGVEFVYPKSTTQLAAANSEPAPPAAPVAEAITPPTLPSEQQAVIVQEQEQQIVAQQTPAQPILMESVPASLPKTAGNFLALPLIGLGLLCGGSTMLYRLRQQS